MAINNPFATGGTGGNIGSVPTGETGKGLSKADVENLLNDDTEVPPKEEKPDDKTPKPDEEKPDEEKPDTEEEEDPDKIKLKDPEEDEEAEEKLDPKDEEVTVDIPPKKAAILKEYPDFFKKFPAVEKMIFRDRAYTELFGSFEDAKEVAGKVEQFEQFESQLLSGDPTEVYKSLKEADPKAFDKIVDNYLQIIDTVDKEAGLEIKSNFAKHIIMGMVAESKRTSDTKLNDAAAELHKYLFGNTEWKDPVKRISGEANPDKEKLDAERQEYMQGRFTTTRDDLETKVNNVLRATISDYIDPRGVMSAYEKKTAVNDAINSLHRKIGSDAAFKKNLDRLWKAAFSSNFSSKDVDGIRKSYLGKATGLLAGVIKEIRGEVLKGKTGSRGSAAKEEEEKETPQSSGKRNINAGRPSQQKPKADERKPGESVTDFFMRD